MRRKKERSKQGQTNNKAKQHSTPKAVTFPKKNELPRVGLEPTMLYTLDRALYLYMLLALSNRQLRYIYAGTIFIYTCITSYQAEFRISTVSKNVFL